MKKALAYGRKTMWKVTCEFVRGVLEYYVEHSGTGERRGTFDCEPWAQEMARELNREEGYETDGPQ